MMSRTVVWTSCLFLGVLMGAMMGELFHLVGHRTHALTRVSYSCKLLPANLLPSCRWRDAYNEWRLHASQHPCPAFLRCFRRSPCWHSWKICPLRLCLRHSRINRLRHVFNLQPSYLHWRMDRFPNSDRSRTRVSTKNLSKRLRAVLTYSTVAASRCLLWPSRTASHQPKHPSDSP
jgi:hypothetical protein